MSVLVKMLNGDPRAMSGQVGGGGGGGWSGRGVEVAAAASGVPSLPL